MHVLDDTGLWWQAPTVAFVGWLIQGDIAQGTLIIIGFLVGTVGAAGIQSIAVPFNIDQLIKATADELSNVIYWYGFGFPLGVALVKTMSCLITDGLYHQAVCLGGSGIMSVSPMPDKHLVCA